METYFYRVICPAAGVQILYSTDRWTTKEVREMYWAAWHYMIRRNQYTIRYDHLSEVEQLLQILERFGFQTWDQDRKPVFFQATIDHEKFINQNYQIIGGVQV